MASKERQNPRRSKEIFVICHNVRSRENVGSVFRTADGFGVSKIYLTGYTPAPPHPKISKTALGAETWIPWETQRSIAGLIRKLRKNGVYIAALENHTRKSAPICKFNARFPLALVLGNEVRGLPAAVLRYSDAVVEIPMSGRKESLNVAVAFGIVCYHLRHCR